MDEKKFVEILENNNQKLIEMMDIKVENNNQKLIEEMDKRMDSKIKNNNKQLIEEMNRRFDEMEQKRIDDNFYFEHTYWDKISIIFDKLQLMEEKHELEKAETEKIQQKIENNSAKLMSHDFRISKLEQNINSK